MIRGQSVELFLRICEDNLRREGKTTNIDQNIMFFLSTSLGAVQKLVPSLFLPCIILLSHIVTSLIL